MNRAKGKPIVPLATEEEIVKSDSPRNRIGPDKSPNRTSPVLGFCLFSSAAKCDSQLFWEISEPESKGKYACHQRVKINLEVFHALPVL